MVKWRFWVVMCFSNEVFVCWGNGSPASAVSGRLKNGVSRPASIVGLQKHLMRQPRHMKVQDIGDSRDERMMSQAASNGKSGLESGAEAARETLFVKKCARISGQRKVKVWSEQEQAGLCGSCMLITNYFTSDPAWNLASGYGIKESESLSHSWSNSIHGCIDARIKNGTDTSLCQEHPLGAHFSNMKQYYDSALKQDCCVTFMHDGGFNRTFIQAHQTKKFRFMKVNPLKYNKQFSRHFGLNDARFFFAPGSCVWASGSAENFLHRSVRCQGWQFSMQGRETRIHVHWSGRFPFCEPLAASEVRTYGAFVRRFL